MITAAATGFRLPLIKPMPLHSGALHQRMGMMLSLTHDSGVVGYGEATPWNVAELEPVRLALVQAATVLCRLDPKGTRLADLPRPEHPAARFALEGAWLDLQSKLKGVPLHEHLGTGQPPQGVTLNALIPHVSPGEAVARARRFALEGYTTLKVKMGRTAFAEDLAILQAIRRQVPSPMRLRVDVNAAWTEAEALDNLRQLVAFDIEYVEQPVASLASMARLRRESPIPLAADESLTGLDAIEPLLSESAADRWILKPMRFGGFRELEEALVRARSAGIPVTLTGMFEGAVATATLLHLAAAWLPPDSVCGLTPGLFSGSVNVHLPAPRHGVWPVPTGAGIGVSPHDEETACG